MTAATEAHADRSTDLRRLLREGASGDEITRHLDALAPAARVAEVLAVTGRGVQRLYDAMASAPALSLDDIVPASESGPIIFEGRNSLPLFSRFQKRFARLPSGEMVGYNHQAMSFVTGPGYFLVRGPSGDGPHPAEPYFDYTSAPPSVPAGWPELKPNDRGLSRSVYMNMKDYMRRVARGVMVGKAYKLGVAQDAYFSLSRAI